MNYCKALSLLSAEMQLMHNKLRITTFLYASLRALVIINAGRYVSTMLSYALVVRWSPVAPHRDAFGPGSHPNLSHLCMKASRGSESLRVAKAGSSRHRLSRRPEDLSSSIALTFSMHLCVFSRHSSSVPPQSTQCHPAAGETIQGCQKRSRVVDTSEIGQSHF